MTKEFFKFLKWLVEHIGQDNHFKNTIALIIICTVAYLTIKILPIPELLKNLAVMSVGFYFKTSHPHKQENKNDNKQQDV